MYKLLAWDEYFLEIARIVATRSKCLRKHYGCVIANPDHVQKSAGFNGTAFGVPDCKEKFGECLKDMYNVPHGENTDVCRGIHAEENAMLFAGRDVTKGCTMYIYGKNPVPCKKCKMRILQIGITTVIGFDGEKVTKFNPMEWINEL